MIGMENPRTVGQNCTCQFSILWGFFHSGQTGSINIEFIRCGDHRETLNTKVKNYMSTLPLKLMYFRNEIKTVLHVIPSLHPTTTAWPTLILRYSGLQHHSRQDSEFSHWTLSLHLRFAVPG